MIEIRKLDANEYRFRWLAWNWMRQQPERYLGSIGFDNFIDFCEPGFDEFQDYSITYNHQPIGMLTCIHRGPGTAEIALITAPKIPVRPLLTALQQMQHAYFAQYGHSIYMQTQNPRLKRLVTKLGWQECDEFMTIQKENARVA